MLKYGVFSGSHFAVFGSEKTSYCDTFHAVKDVYNKENFHQPHKKQVLLWGPRGTQSKVLNMSINTPPKTKIFSPLFLKS